MNTIKGLLIDPENQTITEVNVNPDSYTGDDTSHLGSIYKHLQCSCVDVVRCLLEYLPNKPVDDVWIDDNGNYGNCPYMFLLPGFIPLIGRGLILSYNDANGESMSHTLTDKDIDALRSSIKWLKREVC